MKNNKFALQIVSFGLIVLSFIACDKDFVNLESDIINDDVATNFDILSEQYDIITYTKTLGPVQSNGIGLNTLGIYDDIYGRTTSSFVTQLSPSSFDPVFGEEVEIDSVVLTIPYQFNITEVDEDGNITFDIDSVIGRKPIRLSLYESNYFIRNFDPTGDFNDSQAYFSNKSASETEMISEAVLEGEQLTFVDYDDEGNMFTVDNILEINEEGYILTGPDTDIDEDDDPDVLTVQSPGIRIMLEPTYWQNKIIDKEGETVLSSANNFSEYFRGLYFKAEANDLDDGSFLIINTSSLNANIKIYYSSLTATTSDEDDVREQTTFEIRFSSNSINFIDNDLTTPINNGDSETGDSRIYLKGGPGSIGNIKLFNGEDLDEDTSELNTFEEWKDFFVETDEGKFIRSKRLVNEANLVFYVDESMVDEGEPNRLYLYDVDNKSPLVDYFLDGVNNSLPSFSIINHLGPLQRVDDEPDGEGIKYKLKITEHINNLLLRDSTNVELGIAVALNVNLEENIPQRLVQTSDNSDLTVPMSSIVSPRGTVLHGNNTEDESKTVYLEIYYTEPN